MNKIINIAKKESSIEVIKQIKEKDYVPFDLKIVNSHIMDLNEKIGFVIFKNNSLYINSHSLWELMQPIGGKGGHHYHELTEEDIYIALVSIKDPYAVIDEGDNKYSIVSIFMSHINKPLLLVVEVNANLIINALAKVNKIVTIYPKDKIDNYISNKGEEKILFQKEKQALNTRLQLP